MTHDFNLEVIFKNAMTDPHYAPYCGRCSGLVRMRKVEPLYWKCHKCPAVHDQRGFVSKMHPKLNPESSGAEAAAAKTA